MGWARRRPRPRGWAGLGWAGLGWAGLGWAGLGWAGVGWVAPAAMLVLPQPGPHARLARPEAPWPTTLPPSPCRFRHWAVSGWGPGPVLAAEAFKITFDQPLLPAALWSARADHKGWGPAACGQPGLVRGSSRCSRCGSSRCGLPSCGGRPSCHGTCTSVPPIVSCRFLVVWSRLVAAFPQNRPLGRFLKPVGD